MPRDHRSTLPLLLAAAALAGAASSPARAADAPSAKPADLSALLEPIRAELDVPALAGAIVELDGPRAIGACGTRMRGDETPVTPQDRFHIGSCTKSMTASLVAMLVEEGLLSWETSPAEVFAELGDGIDPTWERVTLAQLVCNTAGAPADLDRDGLWARLCKQDGSPREQREQLVAGVLSHPTAYPPGESYTYSNAGFSIAGAMAERVTKTTFEDLMTGRLFTPLGMESVGFGAPGDPARLDQPRGHRADGSPAPAGRDNPPAISPAGRVSTSLADWARYVAWHLRAARDGKELLAPASFARLHAPAPGSPQAYGYGWMSVERGWGGGRVLTHSGSNTMWYAVAWLAPGRDFAVLAACNQAGEAGARACDRAAGALIRERLEAASRSK